MYHFRIVRYKVRELNLRNFRSFWLLFKLWFWFSYVSQQISISMRHFAFALPVLPPPPSPLPPRSDHFWRRLCSHLHKLVLVWRQPFASCFICVYRVLFPGPKPGQTCPLCRWPTLTLSSQPVRRACPLRADRETPNNILCKFAMVPAGAFCAKLLSLYYIVLYTRCGPSCRGLLLFPFA